MSYQVKSWFGAAVPGVVSHPAVRSLAEKWFQITTEREPCLSDFWHNADDAFLDNAILLLKGETDYTYLHHGRALQQKIGFSMQGLRLADLRTRMRPALMEIYDRCAGEFLLSYFQSFTDFEQEVILWGRLVLPVRLSSDDARPALVLYCHPIDDKASAFKTLFEKSRSGIVIAAPVKNDTGDIVDAWIIAQNEQARHVTGVYDPALSDLLLRRGRIFSRDDVWSAIVDGVDRRSTVATLSDSAAGISINLYTELVEEYLVLRLTTVAPVSHAFLIE
ncbi:MAG TPA: hypothetical protein VHK66_06185 [Microvirga sp.]|jgi:hypothetical protein|nr:hypothetical protein [Microvirga sp.]